MMASLVVQMIVQQYLLTFYYRDTWLYVGLSSCTDVYPAVPVALLFFLLLIIETLGWMMACLVVQMTVQQYLLTLKTHCSYSTLVVALVNLR